MATYKQRTEAKAYANMHTVTELSAKIEKAVQACATWNSSIASWANSDTKEQAQITQRNLAFEVRYLLILTMALEFKLAA